MSKPGIECRADHLGRVNDLVGVVVFRLVDPGRYRPHPHSGGVPPLADIVYSLSRTFMPSMIAQRSTPLDAHVLRVDVHADQLVIELRRQSKDRIPAGKTGRHRVARATQLEAGRIVLRVPWT